MIEKEILKFLHWKKGITHSKHAHTHIFCHVLYPNHGVNLIISDA